MTKINNDMLTLSLLGGGQNNNTCLFKYKEGV